MKYIFLVILFWSGASLACIDCGNEPPIPEREPDLLLVQPIPNLKALEVDVILDTGVEGKPKNIRIISKSSKLVQDKIIIKSIEAVKFITQGEKSMCYAHSRSNIKHKFKFYME